MNNLFVSTHRLRELTMPLNLNTATASKYFVGFNAAQWQKHLDFKDNQLPISTVSRD